MSIEICELRENDVPMDQVTLRDYFAAKALEAVVHLNDQTGDRDYAECAEHCYRYADAMLAERVK